jgi:hypothetical protein
MPAATVTTPSATGANAESSQQSNTNTNAANATTTNTNNNNTNNNNTPTTNTNTTRNNTTTRRGNRTTTATNNSNTQTQLKFKGKIDELAVLGTRLERGNKTDQFIVFRQSLKHYIGTTFTNPADLDPVLIDLIDPIKKLMTQVPKELTLAIELGYATVKDIPEDMKTTVEAMFHEEMKQFVQRKRQIEKQPK